MRTKLSIAVFCAVWLTWSLSGCKKMELIEPSGVTVDIHSDSVVFAIIGDFGYHSENEEHVADLVKSWNPDFIISAGDNNYPDGESGTLYNNIGYYYCDYIYNFDAPSKYRCEGRAFEEQINRFFPCPGNHDEKGKDGLVPYLNYFTLPGIEHYYSYSWGPANFYSINSISYSILEQKLWLTESLLQSDRKFNIVFFHISPFSTGPHEENSNMQWNFEEMGVDVVITGHDHIYSRIQKRGGDFMYLVNGLGGKSLYGYDNSVIDDSVFDIFSFNSDYGAIRGYINDSIMEFAFYKVSDYNSPIDKVIIRK